MAEHLPYYGHEQGCYNSRIPWGPEPCPGCVALRRAFSQGQRDEREAADRRLAHITELLNRQKIAHAELIGPQHPVLIEVSRVEAAMKEDFDD